MDLRPELRRPTLDEAKVAHPARLAARIDGAAPGRWEDELDEFNRLAGTGLSYGDFRGLYGAEGHEDYVRRVLYRRSLTPCADLSRAEMVEIVSRVISGESSRDFHLELFLVNCKHPSGSDLID